MASDSGRKLHELPWLYLDSVGQEFGPIPGWTMREWLTLGRFPVGKDLRVRLPEWERHLPLYQLFPDLSSAFVLPPAWPDVYSDGARAPADDMVVTGTSSPTAGSGGVGHMQGCANAHGGCGGRPGGVIDSWSSAPTAAARQNASAARQGPPLSGAANANAATNVADGSYGFGFAGPCADERRSPSHFDDRGVAGSRAKVRGAPPPASLEVTNSTTPPFILERMMHSDNSLLPPPPPQPSRQQLRELMSRSGGEGGGGGAEGGAASLG